MSLLPLCVIYLYKTLDERWKNVGWFLCLFIFCLLTQDLLLLLWTSGERWKNVGWSLCLFILCLPYEEKDWCKREIHVWAWQSGGYIDMMRWRKHDKCFRIILMSNVISGDQWWSVVIHIVGCYRIIYDLINLLTTGIFTVY